MELTALRTFRFGTKNIRRGERVEMTDARGKEHITRGLAEEIKAAPKPTADTKPKAESRKAD